MRWIMNRLPYLILGMFFMVILSTKFEEGYYFVPALLFFLLLFNFLIIAILFMRCGTCNAYRFRPFFTKMISLSPAERTEIFWFGKCINCGEHQ